VDEDEPTVQGVYIFIAVPRDLPANAVHRLLIDVTASWAGPITYRGLLAELGLEDELARHQKIAEELGL
jgi:hypothetical protein